MRSSVIHLAVLGAGSHSSKEHGPALRALREAHPGEVDLAAVCDLDEAKARAYAEAAGFRRVFRDVDRMLAEERVDGLLAITPVGLTDSIVRALLPRGIPLLIEKPPGVDSTAAARLMDAVAQAKLPHMVSFNRRYHPAILRAREWLAAHAAGRPPTLALSRMLRHRRRDEHFAVETGIHSIDAVFSFIGRPCGLLARRVPGATEGRFSFHTLAACANGATAILIHAPECGRVEETYELHGAGYCVKIDVEHGALDVFDQGQPVLAWQAPPNADRGWRTGTAGEMEAFLALLRDGRTDQPDLADGLAALRAGEIIQAGEGGWKDNAECRVPNAE